MKLINRSALVVSPCQPYADWVNALDPEVSGLQETLSLADHRQEGRVYMIPEQPSDEEADPTAMNWQSIFRNELSGWDEFGDHWPQPLTRELFDKWFSVEPQALVFDLAEQPLMVAALDS